MDGPKAWHSDLGRIYIYICIYKLCANKSAICGRWAKTQGLSDLESDIAIVFGLSNSAVLLLDILLIAVSGLGYGFIFAFAGMSVYLYVVELFPVEVRNAGVGLSLLSWPMFPVTFERSGTHGACNLGLPETEREKRTREVMRRVKVCLFLPNEDGSKLGALIHHVA